MAGRLVVRHQLARQVRVDRAQLQPRELRPIDHPRHVRRHDRLLDHLHLLHHILRVQFPDVKRQFGVEQPRLRPPLLQPALWGAGRLGELRVRQVLLGQRDHLLQRLAPQQQEAVHVHLQFGLLPRRRDLLREPTEVIVHVLLDLLHQLERDRRAALGHFQETRLAPRHHRIFDAGTVFVLRLQGPARRVHVQRREDGDARQIDQPVALHLDLALPRAGDLRHAAGGDDLSAPIFPRPGHVGQPPAGVIEQPVRPVERRAVIPLRPARMEERVIDARHVVRVEQLVTRPHDLDVFAHRLRRGLPRPDAWSAGVRREPVRELPLEFGHRFHPVLIPALEPGAAAQLHLGQPLAPEHLAGRLQVGRLGRDEHLDPGF